MNALLRSVTTDKGLNYLNMALMVLSAAIAFYLPFHLFLFAYAVLGPLHYLTEISWLEKRSFFIPRKWDVLFYGVICILIFLSFFGHEPDDLGTRIGNLVTSIMIVSLVFAFAAIFVRNRIVKIVLTVLLFIILGVGLKADKNNLLVILFSILLPTLIHVYVFTGLFILAGALKQRSLPGILSLAVFIGCTLFFFLYIPSSPATVGKELQLVFDKFKWMNRAVLYVFNIGGFSSTTDVFSLPDDIIYNHPGAIAAMRFIAFAYCYHYLNWFSKTSVIRWHEVSKKRMIIILGLWVLAVTLYAVDYNLGFYWLFILSMLHVMCEFPLNIQTFKTIGTELGRIGGGRPPAKAAAGVAAGRKK